jgi:hypothetical protein
MLTSDLRGKDVNVEVDTELKIESPQSFVYALVNLS